MNYILIIREAIYRKDVNFILPLKYIFKSLANKPFIGQSGESDYLRYTVYNKKCLNWWMQEFSRGGGGICDTVFTFTIAENI